METQTNTTIDPEEIERFSRIASEWWNPAGKFKPLHQINPVRIGWIIEQSGRHFRTEPVLPLKNLSVLDIGCGGGLISEAMKRLGATVTGIDASAKNISVAKLHAGQQGLEIDYRAASAEALLMENKHYDIVLALEIIEHVANTPTFVNACCQLVKPGGLMIWSTLNRTPKSYALAILGAEYILRWLPRGTHHWNRFVKPSELNRELRNNNLEVTGMTGLAMNPLTFKWQLTPKDLSVNYLLAAKKAESS